MTDLSENIRRAAAGIIAENPAITAEEAAAAGIAAERERIAAWHEAQAAALEAAIEQIIREGGTVELSHRSMIDIHRGFATAIRRGDLA